jgi:hypothetical protein
MSQPRCLALVLCLCLVTVPAWSDTALVTAANANLRAAPGTGNKVVAPLAPPVPAQAPAAPAPAAAPASGAGACSSGPRGAIPGTTWR